MRGLRLKKAVIPPARRTGDLNRKLIEKYVSGAQAQEDFEALKRSISEELNSVEVQLKALEEEQITMSNVD